MRFKIILSTVLLLGLSALATLVRLPLVTGNAFYTTYINGYAGFIDKGLSVLLILLGAYMLSLFADALWTRSFDKVIKTNGLAKKILPLIKHTSSLFIWIVAIVFTLSTVGINVSALVTGAGVGGLMFALASKEAVSNLFGSLSLIFSKNFKIGDTIKVKGYEGTVEEISLSFTRVVDKKGTVIFIPNKNIVSETIENLSMAPNKKAEFTFDIPSSLSVKDTEKFLDTLADDITKMETEHEKLNVSVSIEGMTETAQSILVKIGSEKGDLVKIKKDIWLAIKERIDSVKII